MPNVKTIDDLLRSGAIKKGDDESLVCEFLPIGIPMLDTFLGGGLPKGRCVETFGPESTGKTLLAQYATAAVQQSDHPDVLYVDLEKTFDKEWWQQSGVDTSELMVSTPTTGLEAVDIMRTCLRDKEDSLGLIILDSIAGLIPASEMDDKKSSEDSSQPGAQAKIVTKMYRQIVPMLGQHCIFMAINQMRENIGGYDELGALVGGKAQRHYSHIMLRTKRENWITENDVRKGFYMEIISRKNKLTNTPDGSSITLPFMFDSQIDYIVTDIEDAIERGFIEKRGPYYKYAGASVLGKQNLRQFFTEHPDAYQQLRNQLGVT